MKLKCDDGIVRTFIPPYTTSPFYYYCTHCDECGKTFGFYDMKFLKTTFRRHVCDPEHIRKWQKMDIYEKSAATRD